MHEMKQWITRWGWRLLIMITAVFLRLYAIADIPPGLTHDEADHGLTAWRIVDEDVRDIYFPIGYGREPLYDYITAGFMALIGQTYLAGRLTAVFASLILVAALYAWSRTAFNQRVALLTMAGTAVGFWPVSSGRQMLRSTLLPMMFTLAVCAFWRGLRQVAARNQEAEAKGLRPTNPISIPNLQSPIIKFFCGGVLLGLTFYIYIPARILWGVFPLLLLWLALVNQPLLRRVWTGVVLLLVVAGLVGFPLFRYLTTHNDVEARIHELSTPLQALANGDLHPIWANTLASLQLFTRKGDITWRYNIPERPFLNPVMGGLFYLGLIIVFVMLLRTVYGLLRKQRHIMPPSSPALFFSIAWLLAGISPVLVTGPDLSMTQAIGAQPMLYLFPALGMDALARYGASRYRALTMPHAPQKRLLPLLPLLLFAGTAVFTYRDYFLTWANAPEVKVQYESTMVTMLDYVDTHHMRTAAISTITPSWAHSPAVAALVLRSSPELHWFDGRSSLLLPDATNTTWLFPGFATLPTELMPYLQTAVLVDMLPLQDTDLDRPITIYTADTSAMKRQWQTLLSAPPDNNQVVVGNALAFLGYTLLPQQAHPGDVVRVITLWQVRQARAQAQLFVHVWDAENRPLAQADLLGVPADQWQAGDWFMQLHVFTLPPETAVGDYQLVAGVYDPVTNARFPVTQNGQPTGDTILLTTLRVAP